MTECTVTPQEWWLNAVIYCNSKIKVGKEYSFIRFISTEGNRCSDNVFDLQQPWS